MASVNVDMTGVVIDAEDSYLHIRATPNYGTIIGTLQNGATLNITQKNGDWFYATNNENNITGWCHSDYIKITQVRQSTIVTTVPLAKNKQEEKTKKEEKKKVDKELSRQMSEIEAYINEVRSLNMNYGEKLIVQNLNGIYGIPYQFMPSVDPRLNKSNPTSDTVNGIGRKYAEKIITKMPLLCITPGKCQFMSNYSKNEKEGVIARLIDVLKGGNDNVTEVDDIINNTGKYYTFGFEYDDYFNYVNALCRNGARFLEIHDVKITVGDQKNKALKDFDWAFALNSDLKSTMTSQHFIGFYMDSTDSVSESFNNETTQSQLSSTINGVSDVAREAAFLLGAEAGKTIDILNSEELASTMETVNTISDKYFRGNQLLKDIGGQFATVASGGKLLFPEIWSDSQFSKSFDINIKLRTPDGDIVSWYLNIYVPLCHLVALAAGHQTDNRNGYYSPFLIRAFYKGLFNIDMGIITDMSIEKGKEASWNVDGLPTEVDVRLSIKDLYGMLAITPGTKPKNFVTNSILMDYIANTCGININEIDIGRTLEIYLILAKNSITDIPNKVNRNFQDAIDTYGMELFNAALNKFLI